METSPAMPTMSDRLLVMATIVSTVFVLTASALIFVPDVVAWRGEAAGSTWHAALARFHHGGRWVSVFGFMALSLLMVSARRALLFESTDQEGREFELQRQLRGAVRAVWPLILLVVLSGVAVLVAETFVSDGAMADASYSTLVSAHQGRAWGAAQQFLWLIIGLNLVLIVLLLARLRAARFQRRGLASFRAYEDLPQGAALGTAIGVLLSLAVLAWGGPAELTAMIVVFAMCWTIAVHLWPPIPTSGGWRALPFLLALAVIAGDLFGTHAQGSSLKLWVVALVFAFFMVLAARIGRRSLDGAAR